METIMVKGGTLRGAEMVQDAKERIQNYLQKILSNQSDFHKNEQQVAKEQKISKQNQVSEESEIRSPLVADQKEIKMSQYNTSLMSMDIDMSKYRRARSSIIRVHEIDVQDDWYLMYKESITQNIIRLYFYNPNRKAQTSLWELGDLWLNDLGKHCTFIVPKEEILEKLPKNDRAIDSINNTLRQYSILRIYTPHNENIWKHDKIIPQLPHHDPELIKTKGIPGLSRKEDCMQFIVKIYDDGLGSQYLGQFPLYYGVQLFGPFGIGLCITPQWLQENPNPKVVAFSGGTAINIFYDLVYYMYCYTLPEFSKKLKHDFTFHIFGGFKSEEDAYGNELMFKLQQRNPSKFKVHLYFTNKNTKLEKQWTKRFDEAYIKENLPSEFDRIWIRGPLLFEKGVLKILEDMGVPHSKIIEL